MSERSDARLAIRGGWFAPLCRVLAITVAFAVIGPLLYMAVYSVAYNCLQWLLGHDLGTLDETFLMLMQAVYTFAAAPAAVTGAAVGLWREWHGSASWAFVLSVALPIGVVHLAYLVLTDTETQAPFIPPAVLGALHGVTWGAAAVLCWITISGNGRRWLPAGKAATE